VEYCLFYIINMYNSQTEDGEMKGDCNRTPENRGVQREDGTGEGDGR